MGCVVLEVIGNGVVQMEEDKEDKQVFLYVVKLLVNVRQ